MIEAMLPQEEHTRTADVLVCVEPGANPIYEMLAPFGQAVVMATGIDFIGALPVDFPNPRAEPGIGHALTFVEVPA